MKDIIPDGDLDSWLDVLRPYQKNALRKLVKEHGELEAAKLWVTAQGAPEIIAFGGGRDREPFWDAFKNEFNKFICDGSSYEEEKKDLVNAGDSIKTALVASISSTIGAALGQPAALMVPAAAILLHLVGKMGVNAYCKSVAKLDD